MAHAGYNITVKSHAKVSLQDAFDIVLPIDLPQVFSGYGPLPAVVSIDHFDNAWNAAGQSRQINLSDGSHGIENMTSFDAPNSFGYTIKPFTGVVGGLVDHADGMWSFTPSGDGTDIQWSYTWVPKTIGIVPIWALSKLWRPYAERIIKRCAIVAEQEVKAKIA